MGWGNRLKHRFCFEHYRSIINKSEYLKSISKLEIETGQQIDVPKEDRIVNEIIENEDYIYYCDFPAVNLRNQFRMLRSTAAYSFLC